MLFDPLLNHAHHHPHEIAIADDRGECSYQQLATTAAAWAHHVAAHTRLRRVGLLLPNSADFVIAFYGILLAAKTVVPINFFLSDADIAHVVADSEIDAVISAAPLANRLKGFPINVLDVAQLPAPSSIGHSQKSTAAPEDIAVLMYTSGTSGRPKGVPLTNRNLQSNVDASIDHADFQSRHKFLGIVPLFHAFGMIAMMLAPIQLGSPICYMSRFNPLATLKAIRERGISILAGVPSMFAAMLRLKDASPQDFKTIHMIISGGEPLPATLREAFRQRFGTPLYEAYGMTETSLAISLNTPQMHKPGSVGKPVPGMQIKIIEGEICVSGPMVMHGYHNLPAETADSFTSDGYFKTGDLGRIDADGFLHITGRKKDLIVVAGEKVAPREIEETLLSHPQVAEAAVIGKPDPLRGEAVVAYVIPRQGPSPDAQVLREFCRKSGLPPWKVPRDIHIVPDLPRSPTGKVLKRELA